MKRIEAPRIRRPWLLLFLLVGSLGVAHAQTASSTTFTNGTGGAVGTYLIASDLIFVTVVDADPNQNPGLAETVNVQLESLDTGDTVAMVLTETGVNTGIFRNQTGVASRVGVLTADTVLDVLAGGDIQATYTDPLFPADITTDLITVTITPTTAVIELLDGIGNGKTQYALGVEDVFVRVTDADQNGNATLREAFNITLATTQAGDLETVTLRETSVNSGIFTANGLDLLLAISVDGDGTLQARNGDTITARYQDPDDAGDIVTDTATAIVQPSPSSVAFTDASGNPEGLISLGTESIFITVQDNDENTDPSVADTVQVIVRNLGLGDQETVTLTETGVATGIFRNSTGIPTVRASSAISGDGRIQGRDNDSATASYTDNDDVTDTASAGATLTFDTNSTIAFTNSIGSSVLTYTIGTNLIFVTVDDPDEGSDVTGTPNPTVQASIQDPVTGDVVTLTLAEVAGIPGRFRNSTGVSSVIGTANPADAIFQTSGNTLVNANYTDDDDGADSSSDSATMLAPQTIGVLRFTDNLGTVVPTVQVPSGFFLTLTDADQNGNPGSQDLVIVTLTDGATGDTLTVALTETGVNTGVFRNASAIPTAIGVSTANTTLETADGATVTARYVDPVRTTEIVVTTATSQLVPDPGNTRTATFTDLNGNAVTTYLIAQNPIFVTVNEPDANTNAQVANTVNVSIRNFSQVPGDTVLITLVEVNPATGAQAANTGVFRNTTGIASILAAFPNSSNNVLETRANDFITIDYQPRGGLTPSQLIQPAQMISNATNSTTQFTNGSGGLVTQYVIGIDPLFVTVNDGDENTDPNTVQTLNVQIQSSLTGATRTVSLTETGLNTGVFRNTTGVVTSRDTVPGLNDGLFHTADGATITASYADPNDVADATTAQAVVLIQQTPVQDLTIANSLGGPATTSYVANQTGQDRIFVTVTDPDENGDPGAVDVTFVTITGSNSPLTDSQTVTLTETGVNTGIFRNTVGVQVVIGGSSLENGVIETFDGGTVTVRYRDPDNLSDQAVKTATVTIGQTPNGGVRFTNNAGVDVLEYQVAVQPIFVTVVDVDQNRNPTVTETLTVTVNSVATGDTVLLVLTETAAASGTFRNATGLASAVGLANSLDNTLQITLDTQITAGYTDPDQATDTGSDTATVRPNPSSASVRLTDPVGTDRATYLIQGDLIFVTVVDADENENASLVDTINVSLASTITSDAVLITLTETAPNSGTFRNTIGVQSVVGAANSGNGILDTASGATVTANYLDANDPTDFNIDSATMVVGQTTSFVTFIRSLGAAQAATTFAIGADLIFARVIDTDQNTNPTVVENFTAQIDRFRLVEETTTPPAVPSRETVDDTETLTFIEVDATGNPSPSSSIFETTVPMSSRVARILVGNGIIEAAGGSTIRLRYVDPNDGSDVQTAQATMLTPFLSAVLRFTDANGIDVSEYSIGAENGVFITLQDSQQNKIASVRETITAQIFDGITGNIVGVPLTELLDAQGNPSTGIFRNLQNVDSLVALPPSGVTTALFTADGSIITGSYVREGLQTPSFDDPVYDPVIQKILTKQGPSGQRCFDCHRDSLAEANFNVTGFRDFLRGGTGGTPVVPGNASTSLVVRKLELPANNPQALTHGFPIGVGDPDLKEGAVISSGDLASLKEWINAGSVAPIVPTSLTFTEIQNTVLTPSCVTDPTGTIGCHDFGNQAGGLRLDDFAGFQQAVALGYVSFGNGAESSLVKTVTDPLIPHSGRKLNGPIPANVGTMQKLAMYISQQYPERNTVPLREYTGDVQIQLDLHCVQCHSPSNASGGLDLSNFQRFSMGGVSGPIASPGDVPRSKILDKIDPAIDPAHAGVIPVAFFQGPLVSQGRSILTSWVRQGASGGGADPVQLPPVGAVTDTATMRLTPTTATARFTDFAGADVTFYQIVTDGVHVTVTDPDQNRNPTLAETITVTITDSLTTDTEGVTLTETTVASGIFRNPAGILSEVAARIPGDGKIQSLNNSVLTVTYVDNPPPNKTDTVSMSINARSTLRFVDASGLPKGIFFIGSEPVFVQVTDLDRSGTGRLDPSTVSVNISITSDQEQLSLVMNEVSGQPGVFRSQGLGTGIQATVRENGFLETIHDGILLASYADPTFPMDTTTATALTKVTPSVSNVTFCDSTGVTKTTFQVVVEPLFVQVIDANRNTLPTVNQSITVNVHNDANGDLETLILTEVGVNSSIFRATVGLPTQNVSGAAAPGNNVLEVRDVLGGATFAETVRAEYIDPLAPIDVQNALCQVVIGSASQILFTNASGTPVSSYVRGQDLIFLQVNDPDQNRSVSVRESLIATIFDDLSNDSENVTLTETTVSSGIFRQTVGTPSTFAFPLPATRNNRVLETRVNSALNPGQQIRARYQDPVRPLDVAQAVANLNPKDINDTDGDGIPDTYENANGLDPNDPTDAGLDFDNDGWTNLEEFLEGTNPQDPFDRKPVAIAGNDFAIDPGVIQLDGSASRDPRNLALTYRWTQVNVGLPGSAPAVTLSNATGPRPTFVGLGGRDRNGNDFTNHDFDLVVSNFRVSSNPNRIRVRVNNVPPTAFAGITQNVLVGRSLPLNAEGSKDANNDPLDFSWSAPAEVTFLGLPIGSRPIVTPTAVGAYEIQLTAQDPALNTGTDTSYLIAHTDTDHVPLANAGETVVGRVGETISIDGSQSADADRNDTLTFFWSVTRTPPGAGAVSTVPPVSSNPKTNFVPPVKGYYEVTLRVQDAAGHLSPPSTVGVIANFPGSLTEVPDTVPTAEAGDDQTVNVQQVVLLDGRQSRDPENATLTFQWRQVGGVRVRLEDAGSPVARFAPIFPGVYTFELVVTDGANPSAPDKVSIVVNRPVADALGPIQRVPVANAGNDQTVQLGATPTTVVLNGSGSTDADNQGLTFYWKQVSGPGVPLTNPNLARPSFLATNFGTYVFDLFVFDGTVFSKPSRTRVQVTPIGNDPPVARAGDTQTVFLVGSLNVQLDGTGSFDPQGEALSFKWTQVAGSTVELRPSDTAAAPSFVATQLGTYRFRLVVTDPFGLSSPPSEVVILVLDGTNAPPEVKLNGSGGPTATVQSVIGGQITLDAAQSSSRSGSDLTYVWRQLAGPTMIMMPAATSSRIPVLLKMAGTYTFQVTVIDARNNRADGTVTVFVAPSINGGTTATDPITGQSGTLGDATETLGGGGGGGGGGGCSAGGRSEAPASPMLWMPLALFWLALVRRRTRRGVA